MPRGLGKAEVPPRGLADAAKLEHGARRLSDTALQLFETETLCGIEADEGAVAFS